MYIMYLLKSKATNNKTHLFFIKKNKKKNHTNQEKVDSSVLELTAPILFLNYRWFVSESVVYLELEVVSRYRNAIVK